MAKHGAWVASFAIVGLGLVATDAHAEPPAPHPDPPIESGLGFLEVVAGMGLGFAGMSGAVAVADVDSVGVELAAGMVLLLPALQGVAICGVGRLSDHYDGGCWWPIAGAYLGAVALVPLAFTFVDSRGDSLEGAVAMVAALGMGVVLGAPIGATWAWNVTKDPIASSRAQTAISFPSLAPGPPLAPATMFQLVSARF